MRVEGGAEPEGVVKAEKLKDSCEHLTLRGSGTIDLLDSCRIGESINPKMRQGSKMCMYAHMSSSGAVSDDVSYFQRPTRASTAVHNHAVLRGSSNDP